MRYLVSIPIYLIVQDFMRYFTGILYLIVCFIFYSSSLFVYLFCLFVYLSICLFAFLPFCLFAFLPFCHFARWLFPGLAYRNTHPIPSIPIPLIAPQCSTVCDDTQYLNETKSVTQIVSHYPTRNLPKVKKFHLPQPGS